MALNAGGDLSGVLEWCHHSQSDVKSLLYADECTRVRWQRQPIAWPARSCPLPALRNTVVRELFILTCE